ncbi:MAG: hypothetical protein V5A55_06165 [Halovenus sp.]
MSKDSSDRGAGSQRERDPQGRSGKHDRLPQQQSGTPGQRQQGGAGQPQGQPGGSRHRQKAGGIDFDSLPWVSGTINGVAYFLSAFIVSGFVYLGDVIYTLRDVPQSEEFFRYAIGWKFYDNHLVPMGEMFGLLNTGLTIPTILYHLIPALFLFLAGRSVARSLGSYEMPSQQLAVYGMTVIAGYLPMAVLGTIIFEMNGVGPDLVVTVVIMGLIYPAVFGGLGGYLAKR